MAAPHLPVLPAQVLTQLARPGARTLLDGTLGAGGHAALLLEALPEAHLLGLDRDPSALTLAGERLAPFGERATLVHSPFDQAAAVAPGAGFESFDAILLDVGVSSMHLDQADRGFSFQRDGPLDMRMDPGLPQSAADLLAELSETELADLIYELGEERHSRRVAAEIVAIRDRVPFLRTRQLSELLERVVPRGRPPKARKGQRRKRPIHPATRTFQALRLAVNDELGQLERALPPLFELLNEGGRLGVISFHSLEDRRVKNAFRELKQARRGHVLTKKPLIADEPERLENPRSRSAKLRVIERVSASFFSREGRQARRRASQGEG